MITDLKIHIPKKLQEKIIIIDAKPEHLNQGTGIKLYIDQYIQTKHTLFMDADCLCYSSLKPIFNIFLGKNVSVVGNVVDAEKWCGKEQAETIQHTFGLSKLARFNGGVYYIFKSDKSFALYNKARELASGYDLLGFDRIHDNWINEEILISIAMGLYHELPVPDDGKIMTDLYTDLHTSRLNVLTGFREINNPAPEEIYHRKWYPVGKISPVIIHFGSSNLYRYPYISQHILLKIKPKAALTYLVSILVKLMIHIPFKTKYWISEKL